jgi:K+-sensing histidine kinase KdpD
MDIKACLSIVKAIVELHGGRISARNDNGAVFEIRLPSPATDRTQVDKQVANRALIRVNR